MSKSGRVAARERIRLERERAARRQRRNRALLIIGGAVAVVVIAVVVLLVVRPGQSTSSGGGPVTAAYYTGPFPPVTLNADHSVTAAKPGVSAPVLDIYEDFQCPICADFEKANGGMVQKLAAEGKVKVVYHPFTIFLGEQPAQDNSVRAWAAARCVPAAQWLAFHNLLYSNQPSERASGGFPVSQLLAVGRKAGLTSSSFTTCVTNQRYAAEDVPFSEQILKGGITGTPTVRLNGHVVSNQILLTPGTGLEKMILAAK
jgi:protein-disulfide isomerase